MSSSESEAPELINLKTAKSQSKRHDKALEERQQAAARLKKEKNQARDAKLKAERAEKNNVPDTRFAEEEDPQSEEERLKLEKRMQRAMAAAQNEDESEETDESDAFMDEDENATVSEESIEDEEAQASLNPDYLPDHYFEQLAPKGITIAQNPEPSSKKRKRKPTNRKKREEKIVGSRAIRTLSSTGLPASGQTVPSVKAKRFLHRQLKGDVKTKGWERRPVAIGLLASRARPAGKFVRD